MRNSPACTPTAATRRNRNDLYLTKRDHHGLDVRGPEGLLDHLDGTRERCGFYAPTSRSRRRRHANGTCVQAATGCAFEIPNDHRSTDGGHELHASARAFGPGTINGIGFPVRWGGVQRQPAAFTVNSNTQITATVPPEPHGLHPGDKAVGPERAPEVKVSHIL